MAWAIWLGSALLFALIEIATADFIFLMFSLAALAAGIASLTLDIAGQFLTAIATSLILLFTLRPLLKGRRVRREIQRPRSLVGATGTALEEIDSAQGSARINGEVWSARSVNHDSIPHGTTIMVVRSEGTTMVVRAHH